MGYINVVKDIFSAKEKRTLSFADAEKTVIFQYDLCGVTVLLLTGRFDYVTLPRKPLKMIVPEDPNHLFGW